jgi:hypothetical protein
MQRVPSVPLAVEKSFLAIEAQTATRPPNWRPSTETPLAGPNPESARASCRRKTRLALDIRVNGAAYLCNGELKLLASLETFTPPNYRSNYA